MAHIITAMEYVLFYLYLDYKTLISVCLSVSLSGIK